MMLSSLFCATRGRRRAPERRESILSKAAVEDAALHFCLSIDATGNRILGLIRRALYPIVSGLAGVSKNLQAGVYIQQFNGSARLSRV
jgi:hypothetical protein